MSATSGMAEVTIVPGVDRLQLMSVRQYQTELMEQAKKENLIICLPTGSGKTYIAVILIKELASEIRGSLTGGAKRTVFLVKTVQLAAQQSEYIRWHTDLRVGLYYGDLGVDLWQKDKWADELNNHEVLVFTAKVFLDLIDHGYFALKNVNLIIFDECHHAAGEDHYAALMSRHYDRCPDQPRVLGLTASITAKKLKLGKLLDTARDLEKTYRARITHREESFDHGTSVQVQIAPYENYRHAIINANESLNIPFEFLRAMISTIDSYLQEKKNACSKVERDLITTMLRNEHLGEGASAYQNLSGDHMIATQSQSIMLIRMKSCLANLVEVGLELGLLGLFDFAKRLRKKLKEYQQMQLNNDLQAMAISTDILQRFDCLVDDILKNLFRQHLSDCTVLFSPKVIKLLHQIIDRQQTEGTSGRCIVFVERVYTATILSEVLSDLIGTLEPPWNSRLKVKHVTGIKAMFNERSMTPAHQQETIRAFRKGTVNVLIATAVIEEGLDIPTCDLVVRFNKPNNFSSYMQSKGRARAKKNACYVLLMDHSNAEVYERDKTEYDNYEDIEQRIKEGFASDEVDSSDNDLSEIPLYRPNDRIVIDAIRAAQLIMEYCAILGSGLIFPPRFLFDGGLGSYTCILSMPANCPVRDDIMCTYKTKRLAKYACCLEMVKKLHQAGEFNEHCLPDRNRAQIKIEAPLENRIFKLADRLYGERSDSSFETFAKRTAIFPLKSEQSSGEWHLYRIKGDLGFATPSSSIDLPEFHLYAHDGSIPIRVTYINRIDYRPQLDEFCRYLFEYVFEGMHTNSTLAFDLQNAPSKLLPCFVTDSGQIDWRRMQNMCNRRDNSVRSESELQEHELYCPVRFEDRRYLLYVPDPSRHKRGSDRWDVNDKSNHVITYADYFASQSPPVHIEPDTLLITLKGVRRPRINYLNMTAVTHREKSNDSSLETIVHYPIRLLNYAPTNQLDFDVVWKLPSLLVRISQLYRVEHLRKHFAKDIKHYTLINASQMPSVRFCDYLKASESASFLPLVPLTYDNLLTSNTSLQPTPEILFQSVTRRSAGENMDMEGLEILGDCFLKVTVSMCLYHRYPHVGAGALTIEKAKQISNSNLYRIAVMKKLHTYLNIMKIDFRGEEANWLPPGYVVGEPDSSRNEDGLGTKRYEYQRVKRKAVADMMEAFMGAFLLCTDYTTTIQFMQWLGITVIPTDENERIIDIPPIYLKSDGSDRAIRKFYEDQAFSFVEEKIQYEFRNKAYLIAAFTHPSSFANRLTNCYERLEFLGDAVLDFLVIRHVFVTKKDIKPGHVTDIRQDLSNNGRLAYILVASRLHTKIMHNSPELFRQINAYAGNEELFPKSSTMEHALSKDIDQWADSTAPKALADVFEALVGAVFLDSDKCLSTVWQVVEPLLKNYIERSVNNPNCHPVRSFFEHGGEVVDEFVFIESAPNAGTRVCLIEAPNGDQFFGCGVNKKAAKFDACRKAVGHLSQRNSGVSHCHFLKLI